MDTIHASLRSSLADRYDLLREVGRGGMATVYLAEDRRHARMVAIKVLNPELTGVVGADRFLQEIRVMATLQHPNILPLFDSGSADGRLYYVMPYVEGETLRGRLSRERRLGVDDALRIAREVASALDFAHRRGVVHRDIKPENILLVDGHALVADFGIARALTVDSSSAARLTATGMVIGTPGYMSPEQATGDGVIDGRTDIFALGAVTHEMLAGEPPFTGPTAQAVLARLLTSSPTSLTTLRQNLAPGISAAVLKAMSKEPADRFATAEEFARAISTVSQESPAPSGVARSPRADSRGRWVIGGIALVLLATAGLFLARRRELNRQAAKGVRVAVLRFRETGNVAEAGFADGLVASLRGDLATLPNVDVIAGTSLDALADSARIPRYVAAQLGATHVISGAVQWEKSAQGVVRVRIVPELIEIVKGEETVKTGEAIEDKLDDLFSTQARVSSQIAGSLGVRVSAEAATRLERPVTRNRDAFEAYLRAKDGSARSRDFLQRAVTLDSTFAPAWAELGLQAGMDFPRSFDPTLAELAKRAAMRAMVLDSNSAAAQMAMSMYQRQVTRNFPDAVSHALTAVRLAPGNAEYMHFAAAAMLGNGRIADALEMARRGTALDPRNPSALARVALILTWQHDYDGAAVALGRALQASDRSFSFINIDSVWLPLMRGDVAAARRFTSSLTDAAGASTVILATREWYQGWVFDAVSRATAKTALRNASSLPSYYALAVQDAWLRHDERAKRALADSALQSIGGRLAVLPNDERLRMMYAFSYAYAGQCRAAITQGDSANATRSVQRDAFIGVGITLQLAQLLALCGERDRSLALADTLLTRPGFFTAGWMRIDPYFMLLAKDPRYQQMSNPR